MDWQDRKAQPKPAGKDTRFGSQLRWGRGGGRGGGGRRSFTAGRRRKVRPDATGCHALTGFGGKAPDIAPITDTAIFSKNTFFLIFFFYYNQLVLMAGCARTSISKSRRRKQSQFIIISYFVNRR